MKTVNMKNKTLFGKYIFVWLAFIVLFRFYYQSRKSMEQSLFVNNTDISYARDTLLNSKLRTYFVNTSTHFSGAKKI